jgi:hypothetical protein
MLINNLEPLKEEDIKKMIADILTPQLMLNGIDALVECLGDRLREKRMLCTDTNRKILRYKDEDNKEKKDPMGKDVIPYLFGIAQEDVMKNYIEAEALIRERTDTESGYDLQKEFLDKEWLLKYTNVKLGISDKDRNKIAGILATRTYVI